MQHSPLQLPNFRWLWLGQTLVFCAAHFWFVGLTWLILQRTGSGFEIGIVLMAAAIPRGLFMLMGGAISDRLPTHLVATIAALVNTAMVGLVTLLLMVNAFNLNFIILTSGLFGLSEAFLYPAILTLLPQLISKPRLAEANAWMQGNEQLRHGNEIAQLQLG
jgi:MFS family permease